MDERADPGPRGVDSPATAPNDPSRSPPEPGDRVTEHSREALGIEALRRQGFAASFTVEREILRAAETGRTYRPEEVRIVDHYRFEGTSDPDDMAVVYALEARDGTRGLLVDAYGSYADPAVGALLDRIGVDRDWRRSRWPSRAAWWLAAGALAAGLLGLALARWTAGAPRRPARVAIRTRRAVPDCPSRP